MFAPIESIFILGLNAKLFVLMCRRNEARKGKKSSGEKSSRKSKGGHDRKRRKATESDKAL